MPELYPLRFEPIFRRYLWGGRRLKSVLDKPIGEGTDYAESWEIVDRGTDQSVVQWGPLHGTSLAELCQEYGPALLGRHHPQPRFPLLFKFLDCQQQLSLQVHPNDEQGSRLDPPDLGKTEAWVILAADPGSYLYMGLRRGFDLPTLEREIGRGTCELCIERIEPKAGDCFFIPAGMIHALGPGLLVAEIQQSSDTTYRVYDWNRKGPDGKTRPLHVPQAMGVINESFGPGTAQRPAATSDPHVERLVSCDKFVLDRRKLNEMQTVGGDNRFRLLTTVSGSVKVSGDQAPQPLAHGDVVLIPASMGAVHITPVTPSVLLEITLP